MIDFHEDPEISEKIKMLINSLIRARRQLIWSVLELEVLFIFFS